MIQASENPQNTGEKPLYNRVILKLSGEMMKGTEAFGIDKASVVFIAREIKSVYDLGVETGVVIGGGNIFRGNSEAGKTMQRAVADHVGMMATVINALMLHDALENLGVPTRVMTAIEIKSVAEPYIRRRAIRHLQKGRVVIFGAGTGNPFFTTDSAAALRGAEIDADILLKGTKVDGVYTDDPKKNPDAILMRHCTYQRALTENLKVMDAAALSICRDKNLPIKVYNLANQGNTLLAVSNPEVGTTINGDENHD